MMETKALIVLAVTVMASVGTTMCMDESDAANTHPGGSGDGDGIHADYYSVPEPVIHLAFSTAPPQTVRVTIVSDDDVQSISPLPGEKELYIGLIELRYGVHTVLVTLSSSGERLAECELAVVEYCTLSFGPGDGSGTMEAMEVEADAECTLPGCGFTPPDGMRFQSWSLDGHEYQKGSQVRIGGDCEVVAIYSVAPSGIGDLSSLLLPAVLAALVAAIAVSVLYVRRRAR